MQDKKSEITRIKHISTPLDLKTALDIFNLKQGASLKTIKATYKKIALLIHPDQNSNSPESTDAFQKLQAALGILEQSPAEEMHQAPNPAAAGGPHRAASSAEAKAWEKAKTWLQEQAIFPNQQWKDAAMSRIDMYDWENAESWKEAIKNEIKTAWEQAWNIAKDWLPQQNWPTDEARKAAMKRMDERGIRFFQGHGRLENWEKDQIHQMEEARRRGATQLEREAWAEAEAWFSNLKWPSEESLKRVRASKDYSDHFWGVERWKAKQQRAFNKVCDIYNAKEDIKARVEAKWASQGEREPGEGSSEAEWKAARAEISKLSWPDENWRDAVQVIIEAKPWPDAQVWIQVQKEEHHQAWLSAWKLAREWSQDISLWPSPEYLNEARPRIEIHLAESIETLEKVVWKEIYDAWNNHFLNRYSAERTPHLEEYNNFSENVVWPSDRARKEALSRLDGIPNDPQNLLKILQHEFHKAWFIYEEDIKAKAKNEKEFEKAEAWVAAQGWPNDEDRDNARNKIVNPYTWEKDMQWELNQAMERVIEADERAEAEVQARKRAETEAKARAEAEERAAAEAKLEEEALAQIRANDKIEIQKANEFIDSFGDWPIPALYQLAKDNIKPYSWRADIELAYRRAWEQFDKNEAAQKQLAAEEKAQIKAEADAKAKAEAEAKARADAEAKAQATAIAKADAEAAEILASVEAIEDLFSNKDNYEKVKMMFTSRSWPNAGAWQRALELEVNKALDADAQKPAEPEHIGAAAGAAANNPTNNLYAMFAPAANAPKPSPIQLPDDLEGCYILGMSMDNDDPSIVRVEGEDEDKVRSFIKLDLQNQEIHTHDKKVIPFAEARKAKWKLDPMESGMFAYFKKNQEDMMKHFGFDPNQVASKQAKP